MSSPLSVCLEFECNMFNVFSVVVYLWFIVHRYIFDVEK